MVGSTELSARLDPEDLSDLIRSYQHTVTETIERFDCFIAKYMGDGVLVYFGWPKAGEADAERAIRAALACTEQISAAPIRGELLKLRIGIATGLVVVGDGIGIGTTFERTAIGETPNRAARLQALAEPGGIIIDTATRRLVGDLFDYRALGAVPLKGLPAPVEAFEVMRSRLVQSRFEALRASKLTQLVGREEELALLLRRWSQTKSGDGPTVLVCGEPGIGKSRLLAALDERLHGDTLTRLRYFCSPYHKDTPLYPIIGQLEFAAGFTRTDDPAERRDRLHALLMATGTPAEEEALIAALLSLPSDGLPTLNVGAQRRKELTFDALIRQIGRLAARQPVLLLFEDLHWSDASTLELLDLTLVRLRKSRALFVITFRPEFVAPWSGQAGTTLLTLSRLDHEDAALLARQVTQDANLPPQLLKHVVAQADGVPLFIEELTKALAESQLSAGGAPLVAVPETLQASLLARLDRLPAAKQVAQIGSAIGREFSYHVLQAVSGLSDAALKDGLDQLVAAGLAFSRGVPPAATYAFKHALVQDTAYDSLLRSRRVGIHAAIAATLERDQDVANSQSGLIGHHYAQADMAEPATTYLLRAGEEAVSRSAMAEAQAHLTRGLEIVDGIENEGERRLRQARLTLELVTVVTAKHGFGSHEQAQPVSQAVRLCKALNPGQAEAPPLLARALYGDWTYKLHVGELTASLDTARDLLALGRDSPDPEICAAGVGTYGTTCFFLGQFKEGRTVFASGVADPDIAAHQGWRIPFATDPRCIMHSQFARLLAVHGYPETAAEQARQSIERARSLRHLPSIATTLTTLCQMAWIIRDVGLLEELSSEAYRLANEAGFEYFLARAKGYVGWLTALKGRPAEGRRLLEDSVTELDQAGIRLYGPDTRAMLSDVCSRMGDRQAARTLLENALEISLQTKEAWIRPELYRRQAEACLDDPAEAEEKLIAALELARQQSANLFKLRAAVSLARLRYEQGRRDDAHAVLAPAYAWFREGADMPDLVDARALLARGDVKSPGWSTHNRDASL